MVIERGVPEEMIIKRYHTPLTEKEKYNESCSHEYDQDGSELIDGKPLFNMPQPLEQVEEVKETIEEQFIDIYSMASIEWKAIQELYDYNESQQRQIDSLEAEREELCNQVKSQQQLIVFQEEQINQMKRDLEKIKSVLGI